ncbi:hypothetical protein ACQ86N_01345 [Puia sp. P3]|uniref:hypothetical protein n=1 Tax=Puia sp. P3 TaxID=3423952 RepID=UPI003D66879B
MKAVGDISDDIWALNGAAWNIFLSSNDKQVMRRGIEWTELAIKLAKKANLDMAYIFDTKANLLYKAGNIQKAIKCEEIAAKLDEKGEMAKSTNRKASYVSPNRETIAKMREGIPHGSSLILKKIGY